MDQLSTVTLVQALDRRLSEYYGMDDFLDTVEEPMVHDLRIAVNGCMSQYNEVLVQRLVDGYDN